MIRKSIQDQRFRILQKTREGALVKFIGGEDSYIYFFTWEIFYKYFSLVEEGDRNACIFSEEFFCRVKGVINELDALANCYVQSYLYGTNVKDSTKCLMKPIEQKLDCPQALITGIIKRWTSNALIRHKKTLLALSRSQEITENETSYGL